jgi:hypothetical protein
MNSLRKILVVDNGERGTVDSLSAELAELGVSSVTTSVEAADDVLRIIERPAAIFVKMPHARQGAAYQEFLTFADDLKRREHISGVPVIVWDRTTSQAGGISALLRNEVGPHALAGPEV